MNTQERNFAWLLFVLLVFLIVWPVAEDMQLITGPVMRVTMFSWLLAFGLLSIRGYGVISKIGLAFAILGIGFSIAAQGYADFYLGLASLLAMLGFIGVAIYCTSHEILRFDEITRNRVIGAINLYLLFGILWSLFYAITEKFVSGSFTGLSEPLSQGWSSDWIYFSFVTMTTLGYGDIVPLTATARTIAYLQAVFGQFYLAILVAGLVGGYIAKRLAK